MEKKLTRKELVQHIKEVMPNDLSEIEKIAFIEKEVARQVTFDEKYLWGDIETKRKIYKLAQKEAKNQTPNINKKLICVTMAELFGYVLKQFGFTVLYQKRAPGQSIKSGENDIFDKISTQTLEHVCTLVCISDDKYIEVDIQDDIARLQTNSRPKAFGSARHGTKISNGVSVGILAKHITDDAFKKIYGLESSTLFTDEHIMNLARIYRYLDKTPIEMFENYIEDPVIKKQFEHLGCIEACRFYKAILMGCYGFSNDGKQFEKNENKAIIEECILSDNNGKKRYSFCIYGEDDKQKVFYVYSKKSKRMVKLTQEEIKQMTGQVMNVELKGAPLKMKDNMVSYIRGDGEKSESVDQKSQIVSMEDIFLDEDEEEL